MDLGDHSCYANLLGHESVEAERVFFRQWGTKHRIWQTAARPVCTTQCMVEDGYFRLFLAHDCLSAKRNPSLLCVD